MQRVTDLFSSLLVRLMTGFGLVILVTIAIVYVIANQVSSIEFRGFMFRGTMAQTEQAAQTFAAYYAARGSWSGVDQFFGQSFQSGMGQMMGGQGRGSGMTGMMSPYIVLTDSNGRVIASTDGTIIRQFLPAAQMANGVPVQVNGQTVGVLVNTSSPSAPLDAQEAQFLQRLNYSILFAAVAAGLIALALGFLLFYQIVSPLRALRSAARNIASGDLSARVKHTGNDEIGRVALAFNSMAENLTQSETARRNMIADIAHELRNPLGVIQGQLEGMLDGVFPLSPDQIVSVHEETLLLARLVDDLRDLALADAGQLKIARQPTDLNALIRHVTGAFNTQANEKGIILDISVREGVAPVNVDAQRIEQVIANLVGNALRHTPQGGHVTVGIDSGPKGCVTIRVQDTGTGIPRQDLPHVFERFWRGDGSRPRAGGAGLGLAIARQIVTAHGGTIGVESEAGSGATFWFTLPTPPMLPR